LSGIEDRLSVNQYMIDKDVHIKLDEDICKSCADHGCIYICPAGCFKFAENRIIFSYEGCLECGSCRIVCEKGAVDWTLPRPGFGIFYQFG
jgi:ferredoxin like protein